jgi:hypothetical protein
MSYSKNFKEFYHLKAYKIYLWCFIICFFIQFIFWINTESIKSNYDIVPNVPNKYAISVMSLGDKEFLFRVLAERLQNSGDIFAGFVSLTKYDYKLLYQWFKMLDGLNERSNFIPALAAVYYSQTPNAKDTLQVINYLDEHAAKNINEGINWWWMYQATIIARKDLGNKEKALELAYKLSTNNVENAPIWTKEYPALIHSEMGDNCLAFKIIEKILKDHENKVKVLSAEELGSMRYFISRQLHELKKQGFNPNQC